MCERSGYKARRPGSYNAESSVLGAGFLELIGFIGLLGLLALLELL